MKSWFTKFRISTALDSRKPMAESLRRKIAADESLQRFVQQTDALRFPPVTLVVDPSMHDGIMRAVAASVRKTEAAGAPLLLWLSASGAAATVVLFGLWLVYPDIQSPELRSPFVGLALLVKRALAGAVLP